MEKSSRRKFGQNVQSLRVQAGTTQEQLAERADINRRFLQRIEAGQANPSIDVICRIRKALACSWEVLCSKL